MHELSIAHNILEIIQQSVRQDELASVRVVRLKVGALSGIVAGSLEFCFSAIAAETPLARARLDMEQIPFTVHCNSCQRTSVNNLGYVVCPECGGVETKVMSGRELQVTEIELEDLHQGAP